MVHRHTRKRAMPGRLCSVFVILFAACASALAQNVPKGEAAFTEYVAAQLQRTIRGATVKVKGPLTLELGELQANLDRIFIFCNRNTAGCANEIASYVKGVAEVYRDRTAPPSKVAVRIIVRTKTYLAATQATMPKDGAKLQPRPLAGDLVMLPALDTPRTIKMLDEKDNAALGLSADEVFQLGFDNLRKQLKPLMSIAKVAGAGQIGELSGDTYHSSRLALFESWSPLAKVHGGKLIVAVPASDMLLYVGDDSPKAIEALRLLVKNATTRAPAPLSSELLRWTPQRWEVVR
jgi:uncharacterized protein YtpQ (UPF0354 family)